MNKLGCLIMMFFTYGVCGAQNPNIKRTWHWYFGYHSGIDFSSGTAVPDTNGVLNTEEGSAAISDTSGNLLFYTDGRSVLNKNHIVMPNGTGILGGINGSSTQSSLIIPLPNSNTLFYLFTADETPGTNGVRYSIVDMTLDGGNGDVTQKNILLFAPCTEKLSAVNHCNDTSVWIAAHKAGSNEYYSYLLSSQGLDTIPVISTTGSLIDISQPINPLSAQLKFSSDARKAATPIRGLFTLELYDFDSQTGLFSNAIIISTNDSIGHGVEFSFNNKFLYFTRINGYLYQYDISSNDSTIITNSKTLIAHINAVPGFGVLEKAPDGKIYIGSSQLIHNISVINNPDSAGLACNFVDTSFFIGQQSHYVELGLTEFNCSYFRIGNGLGCSTGIFELQDNLVQVHPNPFNDKIVIEINNSSPSSITLYDIASRKMLQQKFTNSVTLNTEQLSKGIYLYEVRNKNGVIKKGKVVKE